MKHSVPILVFLCLLARPFAGETGDRIDFIEGNADLGWGYQEVEKDLIVDDLGGQMTGPESGGGDPSMASASAGETTPDKMPLMLLPGPPKRPAIGKRGIAGTLATTLPIEPIDIEAYDRIHRLRTRLQNGLDRFRKASRKRDPEAKKRAIEEMRRTSAQLSRFP